MCSPWAMLMRLREESGGETGHSGPGPADFGMGWVWDCQPRLFSITALVSATLEL